MTRPGPKLRTDVVDAYVVRCGPGAGPGAELLQLRRAKEPLLGAWHPVMGHIEQGETAVEAVYRELSEETGLARDAARAVWALEQVHPFFLPGSDEIMLSPRFAVEVEADWEPSLNDEHDAARWIGLHHAERSFLWPGQHAAIAEIRSILKPGSALAESLRLL